MWEFSILQSARSSIFETANDDTLDYHRATHSGAVMQNLHYETESDKFIVGRGEYVFRWICEVGFSDRFSYNNPKYAWLSGQQNDLKLLRN